MTAFGQTQIAVADPDERFDQRRADKGEGQDADDEAKMLIRIDQGLRNYQDGVGNRHLGGHRRAAQGERDLAGIDIVVELRVNPRLSAKRGLVRVALSRSACFRIGPPVTGGRPVGGGARPSAGFRH